jgi:hypothetical protein
MMTDHAKIVERTLCDLLRTWLGVPEVVVLPAQKGPVQPAVVLQAGTVKFAVEAKNTDDIAHVDYAIRQLAAVQHAVADAVPLLVVPYMGPKAKLYLTSHEVSWVDLSGNADIRGPGVRILIEGRPNRFAARGRPSTAFSPKATRIARVMLTAPERPWSQSELVRETGLSGGYVSKVVGRLVEDHLVMLQPTDGRLAVRSPSTMLDAWTQVYDFAKHTVAKFQMVGRTGPEVLAALAGRLQTAGVEHAATGLAAAWQISQFADFRLTTLFIAEPLLNPETLGLRPVEQGENVWIVIPNDAGVFYAAKAVNGVRCVPPVQAYVDLAGQSERAKEAAAELRSHHLGWSD